MTAKQFVKKNSSIIATFVIAFLLLIIVSIVKVGYSSPANLKVLFNWSTWTYSSWTDISYSNWWNGFINSVGILYWWIFMCCIDKRR